MGSSRSLVATVQEAEIGFIADKANALDFGEMSPFRTGPGVIDYNHLDRQ